MPSPIRRMRFTILVLVSQLLLIALALAWAVHMTLIAANGSVHFIENNPVILWIEIIASVLISLFGTGVFAVQLYRLGERRSSDDTGEDRRRRSSDTGEYRRRNDDTSKTTEDKEYAIK